MQIHGNRDVASGREGRGRKKRRGRESGKGGGAKAKREDGKTNDTRGYKRLHDNFKLVYELHTRVNILPHRCRRIL